MRKLINLIFFIFAANISANNLVPESYWDIQSVSNPQINSSGDSIIFSKRYIDKNNDSFESEIWIMSSDGSDKRFFSKGSNHSWSNDGTKVAYLKSDNNEIAQISGISLRTVESQRYRLSKKLSLDKNQDLNPFLMSI